MLTQYLPGRRIIKTICAVMICLALSKLLKYNTPIYAGLSCILVMKENSEKSLKHGINRTLGTLYGGTLAMIAMLFGVPADSWGYIILIGFTMLVSLTSGKVLKMSEYAMTMATIMILLILVSYNQSLIESLEYSVIRIVETIIGIIIAVLVNTFMFKKNGNERPVS